MHPSVDLRARALAWRDARRVPLAQHQAVVVPYATMSPRLIARCFKRSMLACSQASDLPGTLICSSTVHFTTKPLVEMFLT
jgi:hypothetical protein